MGSSEMWGVVFIHTSPFKKAMSISPAWSHILPVS